MSVGSGAGEAFELDCRIVTGTDEVRSLHALGRRETGDRYVGTVQDVTERKRIERSLTDAEELLALASDRSPLGMTLPKPDRDLLRIPIAGALVAVEQRAQALRQRQRTQRLGAGLGLGAAAPGWVAPLHRQPDRGHLRAQAARGACIAAEVLPDEQVGWIRGHHERWDGTGYPDALATDDIPDGAQILALADA